MIAGFFGALVGNPADLVLVRIQADLKMPLEERRNYKGFIDALKTILR